jgi:glyoxylase-like metal-dependent hydrolase (beta-lactamase superfamily II)
MITSIALAAVSTLSLHEFKSDAAGFDTKSYFLDTGKEVVVFDAQFTPNLADQLINTIRATTKNPITHVVVTHPNPDKFGGLLSFAKLGAKLIASEETKSAMPGVHAYKKAYFVQTAKMFTEESYPQLILPQITFEKSLQLNLSGALIELRELAGVGVSSNQTVAHIPALNALIVGDLIHPMTHAWLEGGIIQGSPQPALASWKKLLASLPEIYSPSTVVYAGRGQQSQLAQSVTDQIKYLEVAESTVKQVIEDSRKANVAVTSESMGVLAKAIQERLENLFPKHELGYLVNHGVYGLVLQMATTTTSL